MAKGTEESEKSPKPEANHRPDGRQRHEAFEKKARRRGGEVGTMDVFKWNTRKFAMQVVSFHIDEASLQGLDFLAKGGRTRSALIRQAVREYVAKHQVLDMNAKAFDAFMHSLDAEPTQEEREGRRRLRNLRYPWSDPP